MIGPTKSSIRGEQPLDRLNLHVLGLDRPQFGVKTPRPNQRLVATELNDFSVVHHRDGRGFAHGREAMGNDQAGPAGQQVLEGELNLLLS